MHYAACSYVWGLGILDIFQRFCFKPAGGEGLKRVGSAASSISSEGLPAVGSAAGTSAAAAAAGTSTTGGQVCLGTCRGLVQL